MIKHIKSSKDIACTSSLKCITKTFPHKKGKLKHCHINMFNKCYLEKRELICTTCSIFE